MMTKDRPNLRKLFLIVGILFATVTAADAMDGPAALPPVSAPLAAALQNTTPGGPDTDATQPVVSYATRNDVSPLLHAIEPIPPEADVGGREIPRLPLPRRGDHEQTRSGALRDPALPSPSLVDQMPAPAHNFDGLGNVNGVQPPDPQGDVGPDHYVQWVNLSFAIWDKNGNLLYGPANGNTLWNGFGGPCETTNHGDPITLYDPLADRWLMSQMALPFFPYGPFYQCVALSQTGDPTGAWYRYEFLMPVEKMNDYPKLGVWPDGYYMSVNQYNAGSLTWGGAGVAAFERDKMIQGQLARMVYFDVGAVTLDFGGLLPADLDGRAPPPAGSANYFAAWDDSTQLDDPHDTLRLWEFHVDWANPANATFGLANHAPNALLATLDVDPNMCDYARDCIPQPGTSLKLDAISDRLMYRLPYRNMGSFEALVTNHTVDVDGTDHAGIHWFVLHKRDDTWSIQQEGVFAPDADHRWMGSIAMDHVGNLALGYSVAGNSTFPSVRYTGRLAGDPAGTLYQGEGVLVAGTGSQTSFGNRWGDYSMMAVDPVDNCTFWYTQEYYKTNGSDWQTRIGSFRFPTCPVGPYGTLTGVVYESGGTPGSDPIAGASVQANLSPTQTVNATTWTDGRYTLLLSVGTYPVAALAYGYQPSASSQVNIGPTATTTLNIPLTAVATRIVSGSVTDANTGWPLYANIVIQGDPANPPAPYNDFWNDPLTGHYSVTLAEGITHTFSVEAWVSHYLPTSRDVPALTGNRTENWNLEPDPTTCAAPGYTPSQAYRQNFEADDGGYTHSGINDEWAWGTPTGWPHGCVSGNHCWGTDLSSNYAPNSDQSLYSPVIDLSHVPAGTPLTARWWQAWDIESALYDWAFVETSVNGGLWTKIWSHTAGRTQEEWTEMSHAVSAAAGGSIQFRWRLVSDGWIGYKGLYVDDVTISAGCIPSAGGLVIGNVYDDNTDAPLVGADVIDDMGVTTTALATPQDPDVADAFYTLFSPIGSRVFTATMDGGYGPELATITAVQSTTVRKDFYLPAGWLAPAPDSLAVTVKLGHATTRALALNNLGQMPAAFELFEGPTSPHSPLAGRGEWLYQTAEGIPMPSNGSRSAAARPAAYRWEPAEPNQFNILVYADDDTHPAPNTYLDQALRSLDLAYTAHYDADWYGFENDLTTGGPWDLVLVGNDLWRPTYMALDALNNHVINGGRLVLHSWAVSYELPHPLWMTLGVTWASDDFDPPDPVYWWDPGHPFFNDPQGVPEFTSPTPVGYYIYGQRTEPLADFTALAGYTPSEPTPNQAALILGNDDRTVFKGFLDGQIDADLDGDSTPDGVELWTNMIAGLLYGFSTDVPWLTEDPLSGNVPSLTSRDVQVTFDAGVPEVTQPGEYHARLRIDTDTPYPALSVPVTMTVQPPATWGKLDGTITGLGHCDVNPTPLEGAEVRIASWMTTTATVSIPETNAPIYWTVETDADGHYSYWLDAVYSPLTVTVTHPRHQTEMASDVVVNAQGLTQLDLDLRSREPCVSVTPLSMAATLIPGASESQVLVLTNNGAGETTFRVQEQESGTAMALIEELNQHLLKDDAQVYAIEEAKIAAPEAVTAASSPLVGGGPDGFGYRFKDSDEPGGPTFDWIEIAPPAGGSGTALGLSGIDDGYFWPLELPFPFNFYGTDYSSLAVATNGTLYFEDRYLGFGNTPIPAPNYYDVNAFIAHFWDDLVIAPGEVYYLAQDDMLIIEYFQVRGISSYGGHGTWQVIMFDNGNILFQYQDTTIGGVQDHGAWAAVGIQGDTQTGLEYAYATPALSDGLAVCFAYPGQATNCVSNVIPWLSAEPISGNLEADSTRAVNVTFSALHTMTTGVHSATLRIQTRDAVSPRLFVPVTLTVPEFWQQYLPFGFKSFSPDE